MRLLRVVCALSLLSSFSALAVACPNPGTTVKVTDAAGLQAWAADPVTNVEVTDTVFLDPDGLTIVSACAFATTTKGHIVSAGDVDIAADTIALRGDVEGDEITLSAATLLDVRGSTSLSSDQRTFLIGTGELRLRGDVDASDIEIFPGSAKIWGTANLSANGNLNIGTAYLDLYADLDPSGSLNLNLGAAKIRAAATLSAGNDIYIAVSGLLDFVGDIDQADEVTIQAGALETGKRSRMEGGDYLDIEVAGDFQHKGDVLDWGDVHIETSTYRLYGSHTLTANFECSIAGIADPKSVPPSGCDTD